MSNPIRCLSLLIAAVLLGLSGAGCTKELRKTRHLSRGEREFKAQRYDQAEIEYIKVLQVAPQNPDAIRQLGLIYQEEGRLIRARFFLSKAAGLQPDNVEVRTKLAVNSMGLSDVQKAFDESVAVLAKQPDQPEALEVLAGAALTSNLLVQAQQQLDKLRQSSQDHSPYHVAVGTLYLRRRDLTNAENEFKKALQLDPKNPSALMALGNLQWARKDLVAAEQSMKSAAELSPLRSVRRLKYAEFQAVNGKMDEAKSWIEEITSKAPDYVPAWDLLAQLAYGQKKYDECGTYLKRVLGREPADYEALLLNGNLDLVKGDASKAISDFTHMAKLFEHSAQVQLQLARAHLLNNDSVKALPCLNQALSNDPSLADATLLLAQLNMRKGDSTSAIQSLNELIARAPQIPQAHLLLVDAYVAKNDIEHAIGECKHMSDIFPNASDVPILLGALYVRQNKPAEARRAFEKALQLAPNRITIIEQLVNLDLKEKQFAEATELVQKQIDRDPKAPEPLLLLSRIHSFRAQTYIDAENQKAAPATRKLALADVPAAQTEVTQAEAALLKAIDLAPAFNSAYILLADLYVAGGKPQQAIDRLNSLLSKTNDVVALVQLGMIQGSLKNNAAAKDAYEKALAIDPNLKAALNNLAVLYSGPFADLNKASQLAERARQVYPDDPSIADTLGWILYKREDYIRALALIQESSAKNQGDAEIQFHLGMTHYMLGNEDAARQPLQVAVGSNGDFPGKDLAAVRLAVLQTDPKTADSAAVAALQKAVQDTPKDFIALQRLGAIQSRDGAYDQAVQTYQTALKYAPGNAQIMLKLADLYSSSPLKDGPKALAMAKNAHDLAPDDARISALLGRMVCQTGGDPKWAASLLEESARKIPNDPQITFDLANAYYRVGRVSDAQHAMQTVVQSGKSFSKADEARRFLTYVDASKDPSKASQLSEDVQKTLSADANYLPALHLSAVMLEAQGNFKQAAQVYDQILARYPLFTPATRALGLLYFAHLEEDQKAFDLISKARDTFPDDPDVAKALGVLNYRKGNYSRASQLLTDANQSRKNDPELLFYLGMTQYQLKAKAQSKVSLQQAMASNSLSPKLAADAKRILAELK